MTAFGVGVLASGEGTNLQALLDTVHGREGIEIVGVGSDRGDATALRRAQGAGVPTRVFARADFADRGARDTAMAGWLAGHGAALVVLAGYMQLVDAAFLECFPGAVINVHPALLPAFSGLGAIEQALVYGVKVSGVTVHFVDEGMDTGPVILQRAIELTDTDDVATVAARLHAVEHELLPAAIRLIAAGRVRFDAANPRRTRIAD
jgi:phosphoribosylglycinamide formyltransferase-1